MKSTIKVDFREIPFQSSLEPVIKINLEDSDDVRDKLLKTFFQSLGGESSWLVVKYENEWIKDENIIQKITILPIKPSELNLTKQYIDERLGNVRKFDPEFSTDFKTGTKQIYTENNKRRLKDSAK